GGGRVGGGVARGGGRGVAGEVLERRGAAARRGRLRRRFRAARRHRPEAEDAVGPAGGQAAAVGAERQAADLGLVLPEDAQAAVVGGPPQVQGVVRIGAGEKLPVGAEGQRRDLAGV